MMGTFRDKIVKWGAQLLFILLALSFVAWGVGDYIGYRGAGGSATVATVGQGSISTLDFQREMSNQTARMRQMLGDAFTNEQARAMGIDESVLNSMIQDALYAEAAANLGLLVDDSVVSDVIRSDPGFQSAGGGFDRLQFESAVRSAGFSEAQYISLMRGEILRRQYLSPISLGAHAPDVQVEMIYKYRNEKRIAQIVTLPHSAVGTIPDPSEDDLVKYHEENSADYSTPELRQLTIMRMRPQDVLGEIDVTDTQIEQHYNDHIGDFSTPERREISQILFPDEAAAKAAAVRIAKGEDFAKLSKELGGIDLGTITKAEVPVPELADAAFTVKPGGISDPVQSPLGWHLVRVGKTEAATRETLADVRDQIRERIALDHAPDTLFSLAGKFEDELGGGASVEAAAKNLKLNLLKVAAIDRNSRDAEGNQIIDIEPEIVVAAFEAKEGTDSPLGDLRGAGHFMVHVDKVTPPTVRPLAEVKDKVRGDWIAANRAERAEELAAKVSSEIKAGKLLADVAGAHGGQISTTKPFTRTGQGLEQRIPGALISALFKAPAGTPQSAATDDAHLVGVVSQVVEADPKADAAVVKQVADQLGDALAGDLSTSLAAALRSRIPVSIDRQAVDSTF